MITDVEGGDDVVQMGDVFGMISGDVLEADVGESCMLYNEQGGNKYVPKCNHTFYWHPPSMMQLRVSHYYGDVILHFTKSGGMNKPDRYLPMRESEFVALLSMVDEINKQIKKTKKVARKETAFG